MKFMTLFLQAIKAKRTQWFVYCAIGFGFLLLYLPIFPSIQSQAANYNKIFSTLPKGLMTALNITNDQPTLMGYLSSKHFGLVWLLLMILFAVAYGSYAIAKEVESKTMGFLLSQPIGRGTLYVSRLAAGVVGLIIFVITTELVVWPMAALAHYEIDGLQAILVGVGGFLFGLAVLCIAMMFSACVSSAGRASALSAGVLLISYALFIVASLSPDLDALKYFSLFHYFAPGDIVKNVRLGWESVVVFGGVSIVTATIGLIAFKKREIQV